MGTDYLDSDTSANDDGSFNLKWVVTGGHGHNGGDKYSFIIGRYYPYGSSGISNNSIVFNNGYTIDYNTYQLFAHDVESGAYESTRLSTPNPSVTDYANAQAEGFAKFDKDIHPYFKKAAERVMSNSQRAIIVDQAKPFAGKIENAWGPLKWAGRLYYRTTDFIDQGAVSDADTSVAKLDLATYDLAHGQRPITVTEVENKIGTDIFTKGAPGALTVVAPFAVEAPVLEDSVTVAKLGNDRATNLAAQWIKPKPGFTDVVVHGSEQSVWVNGTEVSHRSVANFLKSTGYNGGPVRLVSCSTGACPTGFAQNLANKLGVVVEAPTDVLEVFPDGSTHIRGGGKWEQFLPQGKSP